VNEPFTISWEESAAAKQKQLALFDGVRFTTGAREDFEIPTRQDISIVYELRPRTMQSQDSDHHLAIIVKVGRSRATVSEPDVAADRYSFELDRDTGDISR